MTSISVRSFSVFFLFFTLVWVGQTTQAQTSFTVTNTNDTGAGSLRQAFTDIGLSADPGPFTVTFGLTGVINLTSGLVAPTKNVLLVGPSTTATAMTLRGGGSASDFSTLTIPTGATLSAQYLDFTNGHTTGNGGAINLSGGTLQLVYCYLYRNTANGFGGAIHQGSGSFTITNSTFASNTAISNSGALHKASLDPSLIDNCTFSNNVGRAGGAIEASIGSLTISNSTFTQNRAVGNPSPTGASGGAIYGGNGSNRVTLNNCLIVGNSALVTGPDLVAGFDSNIGYNLIGTASGATLDPLTTGNITGVIANNALFPTLQTNGGITPTHAVLSHGPGYNAGPPASTDPDQRGLAVFGGRRDIGAFESQVTRITATVSSVSNVCGSVGGFVLTVSGGSGGGYRYRLSNAASLTSIPANPLTVTVSAGANLTVLVQDSDLNLSDPSAITILSEPTSPTLSGVVNCATNSATLTANCAVGTVIWNTTETSTTIVVPATAMVYSATCVTNNCASAGSSLAITPSANSFTVTSTADSGPGTLRQAILDMNSALACEPFLITINASGPVSLTAALPELLKSVTITSANALTPATTTGGSTIERATGTPDFRLFLARTSGKTLTLRHLILQRGVGISGLGAFRGGGAVLTDNGVALTMERCLVQSCSTVAQNDGAGIHAVNGPLTLTDSEFRDNLTSDNGYGGAIRTGLLSPGNLSPIRLERCSFIRNGTDDGGAVYLNSVAQLLNCTFDGNTSGSPDYGVAIFVQGGRSVTVVHSTFRNHPSGREVIRAPGDREMVLQNNLFAQNSIPHFSGLYTSLGGNVSDKPDATMLNQATDRVSATVSLSAAAANGGLVQTCELTGVCGNSAIDAGVVSSLTADARGVAYVGAPDAGAYEGTPTASSHPDYAALVDLYNSTNGPGWTNKTGWLQSCDPCTGNAGGAWQGLVCQGSRVAIVSLSNNGLTGTIPASISALTNLQRLYLDSNTLTSGIPASLSTLTNLTILYLNNNALSGPIPTGIGSLTNLQTLYLYANAITGSIPTQLGSLTALQQLYLNDNQLTGGIPATLGSLTALTQLYLRNNQLSGCYPASLTALCGVALRDFQNNAGLPGLGSAASFSAFCASGAGSDAFMASATASQTAICVGDAVSLSVNGGSTATVSWLAPAGVTLSDPATTSAISATATTSGLKTFTVTVSFGASCSSTTTVSVSVCALPTATLTANLGGTLTCAQTSLTLTATGGTSYTFAGPGLNQSGSNATAVVSAGGIYTVTVGNASGCTSSTTTTVSSGTGAPTVNISATSGTLTCAITSLTITATSSGTALRWSNAATTQSITVNSAGTYSVTATGANGCSAVSNSVVVSSNTAAPTVNINPTSGTLTCAAPSLTLTASTSGTGVLWNTTATTPSIVVSTSGTYSVTATASNGCINTTSVTINTDLAGAASVPTLSASSSVVCAGINVLVVATVGGSPSGLQWYRNGSPVAGQTSATLSLGGVQAAQAGSYVLVLTGACSVSSTPFNLTVNPLPTVTLLVPNNASVQGSTITLPTPLTAVNFQVLGGVSFERLIIVDRINGYEIRQVDSNTNGVFPVNRTGLFRLTVTDGNGCRRTVEGMILVHP